MRICIQGFTNTSFNNPPTKLQDRYCYSQFTYCESKVRELSCISSSNCPTKWSGFKYAEALEERCFLKLKKFYVFQVQGREKVADYEIKLKFAEHYISQHSLN